MKRPDGSPQEPSDFPHFAIRLRLLLGLSAVVMAVFLVMLAKITLIEGAEYAAAAERSMFRPRLIAAPRGLIYDRSGTLIASNRVVFHVFFSRAGLRRAQIDQALDGLEPWFPTQIAQWRDLMAEGRRIPREPQRLNRRALTLDQAAPIFERLSQMPGVWIEEDFERHFPEQGAALGHILGYVREVNRTNLRPLLSRRPDFDAGAVDWEALRGDREFANFLQGLGMALGDSVGVQGIEMTQEEALRGTKGLERRLVDAHSQVLGWRVAEQAQPGDTLRLTIDLRLQRRGVELMDGRPGALIAMDPRNGDVLALVSSPGFDSDQPMTGRGWSDLVTDAARPLVNRTTREVYSPGSTIKPIIAFGALRDGAITPETRFYCDGTHELGDHTFRCDYRWGCEWQTVRGAIRRSCNIFFYNVAYSPRGGRLGQEGWDRICTECGFFRPTGIDLPAEEAGHRPGRTVYPGELIQLAIGQGPFDVTPLQMVTAYARLATRRRNITPHLVERIEDTDGRLIWKWEPPENLDEVLAPEANESDWQLVIEAMADVIRHPEGTAYPRNVEGYPVREAFPPEWRAAGKTGTAQNRGLIDAWFIGFAPCDDPQIVIGCVVEGGGHGADTAAPVVRELMREHFALYGVPPPAPEEG
ncbi:hypothetical protein JXA47_12320 [Candidatus Sumerlaeota bacterium]|nr:hypothetical protein [Candidatus Sumerlaeota bacterium]